MHDGRSNRTEFGATNLRVSVVSGCSSEWDKEKLKLWLVADSIGTFENGIELQQKTPRDFSCETFYNFVGFLSKRGKRNRTIENNGDSLDESF